MHFHWSQYDSPLNWINYSFDDYDEEIYWFWQFCMQSSFQIEFFCSLKVVDDFFHSFTVFNRPQWPHPNIDPNPPFQI